MPAQREADRFRSFSRRALLLGGGQLGLFGALTARLYYLQVIAADQYALLADENRINQRILLPERGRIFDRHGVLLAGNRSTYRLHLVPEQAADIPATLAALARLIALPAATIEQVLAEVRRSKAFMPIMVRDDLDWAEVARISIHAPDLPGITMASGVVRNYPDGEPLAHLLGYVGPVAEEELTGDALLGMAEFRIGKSGIEKVYDQALRGTAGWSRHEVNALGREIKELYRHDGSAGQDLELTIDLDLQRHAHERLGQNPSAAAVVLDVHTGEVLALTSVPSFDPISFNDGLGQDEWHALTNDPKAPLVNKAISGRYPPGSTFKVVVALAALEAGLVSAERRVYCPGHMNLGRHRFHCWKRGGHGNIELVDALAQSCDVYFYDLARKVGVDRIAAMARRFGLGAPLEIDLPGESGGLVPDKAWKLAIHGVPWQLGETLIIGIGQGYMQATPLQLAAMTARIANGGRAVVPRLTRGPAEPAPSTTASIGISQRALRLVQRGMYEVVNGPRGTARGSALADPEVAMAGKTGTSQVRRISRSERASGVRKNEDKPWEERDHALFVAYAPHDRPRYAVAVVVEHGGSGSKAAAPIARDIMAKALELDPSRPRRPLNTVHRSSAKHS